jgi:hypothetical protein
METKMKSKPKFQICSLILISRMLLLNGILFFSAGQDVLAQGRLSGTNMAEFQLGNIPGEKPATLTSLYDQLNLSFSYNELLLKTRIEQFYPSIGENRDYTKLSQYQVKYNSGKLNLTVGNLYSTLGRGLLLRTYEIPGSIWETRGYRVRYGFYRDIRGIEAGVNLKNLGIRVLRGKVLDVALPPTLENPSDRRPDLVEGTEVNFSAAGQKPGFIFMRNTHDGKSTPYGSFYYEGSFLNLFSVYGEFATRLDSLSWFTSNDKSGYAAYGNISFTYKSLGVSFEVKDYTNFSIGAGINDPPSLVKEQSYRLLNRSTHVPILSNERGYQADIYYRFGNNSFLTMNHSTAKNEISSGRVFVFREVFSEYQFNITDRFSSHVYADYSTDPFVNETNRYSGGLVIDIVHGKFSSNLETGLQHITRKTTVTDNFLNAYFSYTISSTSKYSASVVTEYTGDPIHVMEDKNYNLYPAVNLQYSPDNRNRIQLFIGKRRGGPACNSGVCYDVLEFRGIEIRLSTRL